MGCSVSSENIEVKDIIFVVLQEHIDRFDINKKILELYPKAKIQVIPQVLNGAVLTCCEGKIGRAHV